MRLCATILLGFTGVLTALRAQAEEAGGRVALRVERDASVEQCIAGAELERAVEARLGRTVFTSQAQAPLAIRLTLARRGNREWSADLALHAADGTALGERQITSRGAHCSVLDESLALVIALLVDAPLAAQVESEARAARSAASPASNATNPAKPQAERKPSPLRVPADAHAPRAPWRIEAGASALLSFAVLPGAALGFELGLGVKPAHAPDFRLLGGSYQRRSAETAPGSGGRFALSYLGLEVCPLESRLGPVRGAACVGQIVGTLRATAYGFDENSSNTRLYYALFARAELLVLVTGRVGARFGARAEAPLSRADFVYVAPDGAERRLFQGSAIAAVLGAGLTVRLQ